MTRWMVLGVHLNEVELKPERFLVSVRGQFCVPTDVLVRWRIKSRDPSPQVTQSKVGQECHALEKLEGLEYRFVPSRQEIRIDAKPWIFEEVELSGAPQMLHKAARPDPGFFLNYDVLGQASGQSNGQTNGSFEVGGFSRLGLLTYSVLGSDFLGSSRWNRLETRWTLDDPERLSSYRIGDSVSRGGSWGVPVRFGGVQWSTNFSTQPGFLTFPIPSIRGEASLPSSVDVYVDRVLRSTQQVPTGPFQIQDVPMVTGAGEVQLVVRDLLGRESVITQPYYVSGTLLRKGLSDFSLEAGSLRQGFGTSTDSYGLGFFSGTFRRGFSDQWTPEVHGEISLGRRAFGLSSSVLFGQFGTLSGSLAGCQQGGQSSPLLSLQYRRQSRFWNVGFQSTYAGVNFSQLGESPGTPRTKNQWAANLGLTPEGWGSFSLAYLARQSWEAATKSQILSANYGFQAWGGFFGSISFTQALGTPGGALLGFNLTRALGARSSISLSQTASLRSAEASSVQIQQSLQDEPGVGYRVLAQQGALPRFQAGVFLQSYWNNIQLEYAESPTSAFRVGTQGSLTYFKNEVAATRLLNDSFALVQVNGYPNVTVYTEGRRVGETGSEGTIFIPRLRAYDRNRISIDQQDLPLGAQVEALEVEVTPFARSGVYVRFPVKSLYSALIELKDEQGRELPSGSTATISGVEGEFLVALHGEVFVESSRQQFDLEVRSGVKSCRVRVDLTDTPLSRLGPLTCRSFTR